MERLDLIARYALSLGLLALAGSIVYFAITAARIFDALPTALADLRETAIIVEPVFEDISRITDLIPNMIEEVAAVRGEVQAVREQVPVIIEEVEQVRAQIPVVLDEVKAVRETVPPILKEMQSVRELMPAVLKEVADTREALPGTLDRVDELLEQAAGVGQQASEGAVKGVFAGVIKAPFSWMSGGSWRSNKELSDEEIVLLEESVRKLLIRNEPGAVERWVHKGTRASGTVQLADRRTVDGDDCWVVEASVTKKSRALDDQRFTICERDGEWVQVQ
jgi:hypothetical protein